MEDRSKTLYRKKFYYRCLGYISKEHIAKVCANRRMCKVCSERQPKVSHGLKIQKYKKKGNNEDSDTKEKNPEKVKCASTNTGSDVISMWIVLVQIKLKDTSKIVHTYALLNSCSQGTFIMDQLTNDLWYMEKRPRLQSKQ